MTSGWCSAGGLPTCCPPPTATTPKMEKLLLNTLTVFSQFSDQNETRGRSEAQRIISRMGVTCTSSDLQCFLHFHPFLQSLLLQPGDLHLQLLYDSPPLLVGAVLDSVSQVLQDVQMMAQEPEELLNK